MNIEDGCVRFVTESVLPIAIDWEEKEYIDPFQEGTSEFWMKIEHLGRYLFTYDLLAALGIPALSVLDAGCGTGYGSKEISSCASVVIGLDQNIDALQYARHNYSGDNIKFELFDFENSLQERFSELDLTTVDVVIAFEFLEHLQDPDKTVRDFYNVLNDSGYLIVSVPNEKFENTDNEGNPSNQFHKQLFDYESFTQLLERNGFSPEQRYGQALTNVLMAKEHLIIRANKTNIDSSKTVLFHTPDMVRYFSYLLAYPDQHEVDKSYSMIIVAKKHQ